MLTAGDTFPNRNIRASFHTSPRSTGVKGKKSREVDMTHEMAGLRTQQPKSASSIACLAFVALMATAFWAGALWVGNILLHIFAVG